MKREVEENVHEKDLSLEMYSIVFQAISFREKLILLAYVAVPLLVLSTTTTTVRICAEEEIRIAEDASPR